MIDTHAHLNDDRLINDIDEIICDMQKDSLQAIINVGYDEPSSRVSVDLANKYRDIYATVGIHPHEAKSANKEAYSWFEKVKDDKKVVAIGEIGLDFYYDNSPREIQERVFLEQLEIASALKLPVAIHLRDAYQLMLKLLRDNKKYLQNGFVLHCYSGSKEMLKEYAKLDAYFAFGGAITFKNASKKPDIVRATPIDKLLLETDCPYMTPVPYRGKTNYPKYVKLVAEAVAKYNKMTFDEVRSITTKNARTLFNKII